MTQPSARARAPWPVFAAVALGTFMSTLDSSIVNVALPTMQNAFHASVTSIGWVSLSYLLTLTVLLLPFGRLGDAWGRRPIYLCGLAVFVVGSALCGLARGTGFLIAARVLQGVGASMVSANVAAIVTAAFPASMRGRALGSIGAVVGLGLTVGPPLGGLLLEVSGWPAIFFVNLPIGAVALVMAARLLPADPAPGERRAAARAPLLDPALLRDPVFTAALGALLLSFVALFTAVFLAPFYLERVTGLAPARVGQVLVVVPLLLLLVAPAAGTLSDRTGTRGLAATGLALVAVGLGFLAWLVGSARTPVSATGMISGLFVIGLGHGMFQPSNSSAAMGSVPPDRLGLAGGLVATMRNLGMGLGIALAAATFEARQAVHQAAGAGLVASAGRGMRDALLLGAAAAVLAAVLVVARGQASRRLPR